MTKLTFGLVAAIVIGTTPMATAQTYMRQAPGTYAYSNMYHSDSIGSTGQYKSTGENGGG